jgi:hypothetical protein
MIVQSLTITGRASRLTGVCVRVAVGPPGVMVGVRVAVRVSVRVRVGVLDVVAVLPAGA